MIFLGGMGLWQQIDRRLVYIMSALDCAVKAGKRIMYITASIVTNISRGGSEV